ncbi:MAG: hypothetical protein WEA31_00490 [Pirellulales bacterium]
MTAIAADQPRPMDVSGPLFTSACWDVDAGVGGESTPWGHGVSQVSPEEPVAATIFRIDEAHAAQANASTPRAVRSPHWVFVPITRREQPTKSAAESVSDAVAPEHPAADWRSLNLRNRQRPAPAPVETSIRIIGPAAQPKFQPIKAESAPFAIKQSTSTPAGEKVSAEVGDAKPPSDVPAVEPRANWLRPALEVDQFRWPDACQCIVAFAGGALDQCARKILNSARSGRRVVMVSGHERGEGRTTFLLCLAQRLSVIGVKTALVDGDFANPQLARRLGLVPDAGWDDVLAGKVDLAEVMIDSLQDKLSLAPAVGRLRSTDRIEPRAWSGALDALRTHYQVVLIDTPPANEFLDWESDTIAGIDSAIVVQRGAAARSTTARIAHELRLRDICPLGHIQNFVDESN